LFGAFYWQNSRKKNQKSAIKYPFHSFLQFVCAFIIYHYLHCIIHDLFFFIFIFFLLRGGVRELASGLDLSPRSPWLKIFGGPKKIPPPAAKKIKEINFPN